MTSTHENDPTTTGAPSIDREERSARIAVIAFPLFILIGAAIAFFNPEPFKPLSEHITVMIAIIMLCMGLTLTLPDFTLVIRRPLPIIVGVIAQFVIMPLGAVAVAKLLGLNPMLAIGLLMLGSVPGGTTSNVVAYLSRGDVALSVTMTSVSTVFSPIVTPIIMLLLAGEETPVDGKSMAWSLVQTVLLPVVGGLIIRVIFDRFVTLLLPVLPWLSVVAIGGVVFPAVANSSESLKQVGLLVIAAVILHNLIGYVLGYIAAKVFKFSIPVARTTSIEVATQSAGLASGMSSKLWSPEAAIPGAVAAVWHNISGALFAFLMRRIDANKGIEEKAPNHDEVPVAS
ncbi:Sodium Bile acid symporter family protein [Corynebacterium urogenitale]|uniref:Sodium Bile acid symporter family protein n=1 Tax=Corynebacterium urogenitale TaxID=2487892 RepID=A0A5J6Z4Y7_9CORY|nr:bile acid:sodium symporter family protein [Corynebacterium urogenitale]QFQ02014.1 Sodium Bile acid symporter family protein [Corynebacterium urogenitale]